MTTKAILERLRDHFKPRKITRTMIYRAIDDGKVRAPMRDETGRFEWEDYHFKDVVAALTKKPKGTRK